jgi:hypothetical protein
MLYNGERRWQAATTARELIALSPDSTLWPWQPHGRYYLLFRLERICTRSSTRGVESQQQLQRRL